MLVIPKEDIKKRCAQVSKPAYAWFIISLITLCLWTLAPYISYITKGFSWSAAPQFLTRIAFSITSIIALIGAAKICGMQASGVAIELIGVLGTAAVAWKLLDINIVWCVIFVIVYFALTICSVVFGAKGLLVSSPEQLTQPLNATKTAKEAATSETTNNDNADKADETDCDDGDPDDDPDDVD